MRYLLFILFILTTLTSCHKEDDAIQLPPPGEMQRMVAVLGSSYTNQVYVSLANKSVITRSYSSYDLAFEMLDGNLRVWTNSGKIMMVARSGSNVIGQADSIGKYWWVDQEQHHPDSSAIGNWWLSALSNVSSEVMIIDRGKAYFNGNDRFRKFQIVSANPYSDYHIRYSLYDNSGLTDFIIPRDTTYSLTYFSFNNNGELVNQAPPKDEWDFVFTKYNHVYFDFPYGSVFRNYPVVGAQLNIWNNVHALQMQKDTFPNYMPFEDFTYSSVNSYIWPAASDVIGFDWKYFDFNNSRYYVVPDNFFIVCDRRGIYYKMRMLDFYDDQGNKGTVTFEYQRI